MNLLGGDRRRLWRGKEDRGEGPQGRGGEGRPSLCGGGA